MIKQGLSQSNRLTELNRIAKEQLEVLYKNNQKALDNLKRLADKEPHIRLVSYSGTICRLTN